MKVAVKLFGVLVAMSLLTSSAAAQCAPIAPKQWTGSVQFGTGGWITTEFFENNACDWGGQEASMNGIDAFIFDIQGYAKLPVSIHVIGGGQPVGDTTGIFISESCERQTFVNSIEQDTPTGATVPEGARWLAIVPPHGAAEMAATVQSAGQVCTAPKKKKKRRR
jgi:hypothetical protein